MCQRAVMTYAVKEEIVGRDEPPAHSSPRFCGDTRTNAAKSSFEFSEEDNDNM
jgi:hypothetical protein